MITDQNNNSTLSTNTLSEDTTTNKMPSVYKRVIVGMGPVGLAAAYESAKNGNSVLIIEKRSKEESNLRPQVVVLDPARKRQLLNMIGQHESLDDRDLKFLDSLASSAEVKISAVQKFIMNRINNLKRNGYPIDISYETTLSKVDLANGVGTINFKDNSGKSATQDIEFSILVAADGAGSPTRDLVNQQLPQNLQINRDTSASMRHLENTRHLGAYIKLKRKDGGELVLPKREFVSSFLGNKNTDESESDHQLYFLRFDKKSYLKRNQKEVKLGFIGEVPIGVYDQYQARVETIKELRDQYKLSTKDINDLQEQLQALNQEISDLSDELVAIQGTKDYHTFFENLELYLDDLETYINDPSDINKDKINDDRLEDKSGVFESTEEIEKRARLNEIIDKQFKLTDAIKENEENLKVLQADIETRVTDHTRETLTYVKRAAADYLDVNSDEIEVEITPSKKTPGKDKLKMLTFKGGSQRADKAAIEVNNRGFYLIGDAYFTPNYPVGHGLNDGLEAAALLGAVMPDGIKMRDNIAEYNQLTANNANYATSMMGKIRKARKFRGIRTLLANLLEKAVDVRENTRKIDFKSDLTHTIDTSMGQKDDVIDNKIREIFKLRDRNNREIYQDINNGYLNYGIGFIAMDATNQAELTLEALEKLSDANGEIPIFIQKNNSDDKPTYLLFRYNKATNTREIIELKNPDSLTLYLNKKDDYGVSGDLFTTQLKLLDGNKNFANLLSSKFLNDPNMEQPLHYQSLEPDIMRKITQWDKFLKDCPTIINQYRIQIMSRLIRIEEKIKASDNENLKEKFNTLFDKYKAAINTINERLIQSAKADPNKLDQMGQSPLYRAVQNADLTTITDILKLGANPNKATAKGSIFSERAYTNPDIARLLMEHGANPFKASVVVGNQKISPFMVSFIYGDTNDGRHLGSQLAIESLIACKENPAMLNAASNALSKKTIDKMIKKISTSVIQDVQDPVELESMAKRLTGKSESNNPRADIYLSALKILEDIKANKKNNLVKFVSSVFSGSIFGKPKNDTNFGETNDTTQKRKLSS